MPHGIAAQASEQVAAAPRTSSLSSSHFTASRLLVNRPDRASWSPPVSGHEHHGNRQATTTTTTARHLTHKTHAESRVDQRPPTNHERDTKQETNGRPQWQRASSHELSLSPSSSSLDDQEEDDPGGETAHKGMQSGGNSSSGKPHVGPMGIFFKVWSLVKVTKARHNKMRRQHSEDAGQMHHFSAGDRPATNGTLPAHSSLASTAAAAAASGHQTQLSRQAHILQDGHFRRAGSQPPPSSHLEAIGLGRNGGGHPQVTGDSSAGESTNALLQTTSTTGTNGSSSGVSSTTSSTIAANSFASRGGGDQVAGSGLAQQQQQQRQRQAPNTANRGSWASRMKRSALAADEPQAQIDGASYVSRYRFRRGDPDQRQVATGSSSATPAETEIAGHQSAPNVLKQQQIIDSKRQSRAHSEAANRDLDEMRRQRAQRSGEPKKVMRPRLLHLRGGRGGLLRRDSMSDEEDRAAEEEGDEDGDEDEDEEEEGEEQRTQTDSEGAGEDEDSDLNDIYSTPNDSIQSVPSGGRLPDTSTSTTTALGQTTQLVNKRTPVQPSYQMTKSFSANNFNPRLNQKHHQQQSGPAANINRIDENKVMGSAARLDLGVTQDVDEQQYQKQTPAARTQRSSNGSSSRFFISSSSSEDSNTTQQRHSSSTSTVRANQPPTSERVPLSTGLHYHAPPGQPPTRPDTLLIPIAQPAQLSRQQPPNLMTPSALIMNGLGGPPYASVAAMSPTFPLPVQDASVFAVHHQQQQQLQLRPSCQLLQSTNYKKSPSLFEMSSATNGPTNLIGRFSSRYPYVAQQPLMLQPAVQAQMSSFIGGYRQAATGVAGTKSGVPHSISLHDCKLITSADTFENGSGGGGRLPEVQNQQAAAAQSGQDSKTSEYKLAQMLLELGRSRDATGGGGGGGGVSALKDQLGYTALMHAIISENLSAIKCLIEHGVDLNETNNVGQSALDLVCAKQVVNEAGGATANLPLEMMKLLIEHQVDLDAARASDGTRLLDRLIGQHDSSSAAGDKIAFIDCLLHNGAKLGSATWAAASGKHEIQLRLLRKLCQDGYYLYKKSAIEAAVYRFEYALKRIAALEQQLGDKERRTRKQRIGPPLQLLASRGGVSADQPDMRADQMAQARGAVQQIKYQTFLGLSRCERKRRFFKRALEFAHMSILVDSTSYEGYYSKAHILKDLGEVDDALLAIDQTERLVVRSIETVKSELCELENQQESIVFDGCFQVHDPQRARWIVSSRAELSNTLDYLLEAKKHSAWLRAEILDDKKRSEN